MKAEFFTSLSEFWRDSPKKGAALPVKWLMMSVLVGLVVAALSWPTTATQPYTLIIIEDGSPYFVPVTATVASGNPIRWGNPTPTLHTITHNGCVDDSGLCAFDSGTMPPEDTFTLPGLPPGRYVYHCRIHPIMRGVLTVTDSSRSPSQL
jgi:plastocyanin